MNFKDVQEKFSKLRLEEDDQTLSKLSSLISSRCITMDISNFFLFKKSSKFLIKSLSSSTKPRLKHLILQNCMLTSETLSSLLKVLTKTKTSLLTLDLSNNRLKLDPSHARLMSKMFSQTNKCKNLMIRGNNSTDPHFYRELYFQEVVFKELDLYDSGLTAESLVTISKILSLNKNICKLNLGYNSEAFANYVNVSTFALSVSENSFIQHLVLSENESLAHPESLRQLSEGLKKNRSIISLDVAGVNLQDSGLTVLTNSLLQDCTISSLNLSNNDIQDAGLECFSRNFPKNLSVLDLSYNNFSHPNSVLNLGQLLKNTKSLRKLNISHCFELEEFNETLADIFCSCIMKNDSLASLKCEGFKVPLDPDVICNKLKNAIEIRKLSLTYKFSALNSSKVRSTEDSIVSNEFSVRIISKVPSSVWNYRDSASHTEKKEYIDSPNQEPIITTSKQITFLSSYD
jgi:hypothetical protein